MRQIKVLKNTGEWSETLTDTRYQDELNKALPYNTLGDCNIFVYVDKKNPDNTYVFKICKICDCSCRV